MHSTHHPSGDAIHHSASPAGRVVVRDRHGGEAEVPAELLIAFVAELIRSKRIEQIEQAADHDLLGL